MPDIFEIDSPPGAPRTSVPGLVSDREQQMLDALPPPLRGSYDYIAVIHAYARELDLLEAAAETVRAQLNPATADLLLEAWEYELRLPVGGAGADIPTRQARVLARLRVVLSGGEGREWEDALTGILGIGWTYLEHDPADPSSPAPGVIKITVPWPSGTSRFIEAQNQVRDLTDAHLEVEFDSSTPFLLDSSEMDSAEFGV